MNPLVVRSAIVASLGGLIFVISCYTFPYVFVLVANALDRIPGDLEDASAILGGRMWVTARRVTIPLALPAVLASALVAFLQAMTLFGSPAILALPAGFHTMTTKIWSLFQYPPKLELAAAADVPLLLLTILLLQGQKFLLGRRGYEEFAETLSWLLEHTAQADAMGRGGRAYFERHYAWDVVMAKYDRLLRAVAGCGPFGLLR